jgi:hypothetical protein
VESILYIETSLPPSMTLDEYRRARGGTRRYKRFFRWFRA